MDAEALIKTLRAYDPSFDAAAVRAVLGDPKSSELRRWAAVHLTPDTLLTVDELSQYAVLEESGRAEKLAMSSDLTTARVLSDHEIKDAIDELNRSTQAIRRHTETLKQQQQALGRLVNANRQGAEERLALEEGQTRKWEAQCKDLAFRADDLTESLHSRVHELEQRSTEAGPATQQLVDSLLCSDDKLLSSLQKLGWELQTEDTEEQEDVAALREACARLIKFTVEGIRTKLDRIYLESIEQSVQSRPSNRVSADEVSALQQELESLYAEILPVAQMSTEQQFLEPALQSLAAKNGQGLARSAQATSYIHECLDYLLDRARDLMTRLEVFQEYQRAVGAVVDIAKQELLPDAAAASPTKQKSLKDQEPVSPIRPRPKQRPRHSSGAPELGAEPPLEEILRAVAVSLPHDEEAPPDVRAQVNELVSTLHSRQAKVQDIARNVQETFESAAARQIADGKLAIQLVRDSILAESPFGEVRLVDPEIEGSLTVLSQELANIDDKLKETDTSVAKLRGRNAKRDELISRWGS
ncbi:uncharacterized protein B0T15DRAFT_487707 [Chaetomium strumarium]|uniref:Uncharacterized protein n=1 Tax=Chaetomium strumarium TaxID=1170767 RepID=A0AAJ0GMG2_9PEZI|nr:hypothetical protein B0T15DRAFT_487707 [Chaetomium strumarium]